PRRHGHPPGRAERARRPFGRRSRLYHGGRPDRARRPGRPAHERPARAGRLSGRRRRPTPSRDEADVTNAITGLDHAVILVRDLDAAEAKFRKLGFTLTQRGRHTRMGTANHCIMLGNRNYFELLTVVEPNPTNAMFRPRLEEREGLMALAWQTEDARAVGKAWAEAGLAPQEP